MNDVENSDLKAWPISNIQIGITAHTTFWLDVYKNLFLKILTTTSSMTNYIDR